MGIIVPPFTFCLVWVVWVRGLWWFSWIWRRVELSRRDFWRRRSWWGRRGSIMGYLGHDFSDGLMCGWWYIPIRAIMLTSCRPKSVTEIPEWATAKHPNVERIMFFQYQAQLFNFTRKACIRSAYWHAGLELDWKTQKSSRLIQEKPLEVRLHLPLTVRSSPFSARFRGDMQ